MLYQLAELGISLSISKALLMNRGGMQIWCMYMQIVPYQSVCSLGHHFNGHTSHGNSVRCMLASVSLSLQCHPSEILEMCRVSFYNLLFAVPASQDRSGNCKYSWQRLMWAESPNKTGFIRFAGTSSSQCSVSGHWDWIHVSHVDICETVRITGQGAG